ncbi:KPN_02809 family neutral zinc metallopeptidase [Nocardioides limicola]|uniref:KPN_02809 family neutral zinc metallopeptidase n=1 Tax=Nocardioides limicola TaxID=2803368 RepID=UPI00193B15D2|nr:neutral zinc metallopeptidase [Nocardioides sp. DJM-14]
MKFNPKARIDTGRISHSPVRSAGSRSVGGRAGGTGRAGVPIPMGRGGLSIGGVIVVVLVVLLGNWLGAGDLLSDDPGGSASGTDRYAACATGADANRDADCARVAVENSLVTFWTAALPQQAGQQLRPATLRTFDRAVATGCGNASSQLGPFYCPVDQTIYLDTTFFPEVLQKQLGGSGGEFVEPYVLAHEYGHHVQNLLGYLGRVRSQQGASSDAVRLELQADCLAGMWAGVAASTTDESGVAIFSEITRQDIEDALDGARSVGDDRIQQRTGGRVNPDGWTHGSSEQRMRWFMVGYQQGDLTACDTFKADRL